jgi:putative endonuclease
VKKRVARLFYILSSLYINYLRTTRYFNIIERNIFLKLLGKRFGKTFYSPYICILKQCGVEQLVARRAHNPEVGGSSPSPATKTKVGIKHSGLFYFPEVMFTVYVLYSRNYDKIYIGYSSDVKTRLIFHNNLSRKGWTLKYRSWEIVHTEIFDAKTSTIYG